MPVFQPTFHDRIDAGRRLAGFLTRFGDEHPLVLGIARGGVPVAAEVADALRAELDVLVARKIGVPWRQELALGAVTADGATSMNDSLVAAAGLPHDELEQLVLRRRGEAAALRRALRDGRAAPRIAGRTVIVVDDGLATGATMIAALREVRARRPQRLVVAVPVGAQDSLRRVAHEADEVVCLYVPEDFDSVGAHYSAFPPTPDEEVRRLLAAPHPAGSVT